MESKSKFLVSIDLYGELYLLKAASWSIRTSSRSLWTAIQSLSFHSITGPSAPFLDKQNRKKQLISTASCDAWNQYQTAENLIQPKQLHWHDFIG